MWPFSRGRIKQANAQGEPKSRPDSEIKYTSTEHSPEDPSLYKRRRTTEYAFDRSNQPHVQTRRHRARESVENITALPGARRLETSPHLRQSNYYRTAIPYNSQPSDMATLEKGAPQQKRLSKRQVYHDRAVREEEIRAMSARVHIPKRVPGHGDMLLRENKKARRAFNSKATNDTRGSDVSLPFQDSIHSSMSGGSDSRGWEIQRLNLLSPRPSVRISSSGDPASGMVPHLYKRSKKNKVPTVQEGGRRKDRRKVGEIADDMDAADLRVLMERETRRKERRAAADRVKLVTKLRRRASRSRGRERTPKAMPDIAHHPAFRSKHSMEKVATRGRTPPRTLTNGSLQAPALKEQDPFRDPSPSLFADPTRRPLTPGGQSIPFANSDVPTPIGSAYEDVVLVTAEEVRYSHGRLSQIGLYPPGGLTSHPPDPSNLHRELTPESYPASSPSPNRMPTIETDDKRKASGNWANFFRRRSSAQPSAPPPATTSFSNLSRDSMSKQPLPTHLASEQPRRKSSTPARTVSVFKEHLPETMPTRTKAPSASPHGSSPIDEEEPNAPARPRSKSAISNSLASVDSEGSWLASGHPRTKMSFEDLGVPDGDVLRRSTRDMDALPSIERQLQRTTSRGTPVVMHNGDAAVSREALHDEELAMRDSSVSSLDDDDYEYEIVNEEPDVVFGHGHPRQLSAGSVKLLEIPSRTRSVREGEMSPSLWGGGGTGLVSPPESPRRV